MLAFTVAQTRDLGVATLVAAGLLKLRGPRFAPQRAAARAIARGLRAEWLLAQDWPAELATRSWSLNQRVRRVLRIEAT